jgi:cold shock CspA family protein
MARNLKKGSKVCFDIGRKNPVCGVVIKKFTVRKGSVVVDPKNPEARTLVHVRAVGSIFSKRPSQLKRRK